MVHHVKYEKGLGDVSILVSKVEEGVSVLLVQKCLDVRRASIAE